MNFILTLDCNKGCPYCFASKTRNEEKENRHMSFELFCEYLDKHDPLIPVKFLGGEPTQHPDFLKFLDEAINRKFDVVVISNFLFNDDILNALIERLKKYRISFLINSTNLDVGNRIERFKKNYNTIYEFLYQYDAEEVMSCGITFEEDKDWKYYVNYIEFLHNNLLNIEKLRLSIAFPDKDKNPNKIINNKEVGVKFITAIKKCQEYNIKPNLDCIVMPCLFSNKEEYKLFKKFIDNPRFTCDGCPADLFPDGTVSYCYPLKDSIKLNTKKYRTGNEMSEDMKLRSRVLTSTVELPEDCKECSFRKENMCNGPCLGWFDLSDQTLGKNL